MDLNGVFNIEKLQRMLSTMAARMEHQEERLRLVESELAQRPTIQEMNDLQDWAHAQETKFQEQIQLLHKEISHRDLVIEQLKIQTPMLEQCVEAMHNKADRADLSDLREEVSTAVQHALEEFEQDKASSDVLRHVEQSQDKLFKEMVAIQNLVSCKVDRSEFPMLEAAAEQLRTYATFRKTTERELDKLASQCSALGESVKHKEDKTAMRRHMHIIQERLQRKVDTQWAHTNIVRRLDDLDKLFTGNSLLKRGQSFAEDFSSMKTQLNKLHRNVVDVLRRQQRAQSTVSSLQSVVANKADVNAVEKKIDATECKKLVESASRTAAQERGVHAAFISDVRQLIADVLSRHDNLSQRVDVALKFVDWFTEAKLDRTAL